MTGQPIGVSLADQIRCVGRELGMRRTVYPKFIASGRMKQDEADREIERMDAVYATLKALQSSQEPGR
jgi:hypothetical protein